MMTPASVRPAAAVPSGPCGPARTAVDGTCAEAERLAAAAQSHQKALAAAREQHLEIGRLRDADMKWRDRRWLADEKQQAQSDYHAEVVRATDQRDIHDAAAGWLRRIDQLNRQARVAQERADGVAQQAAELERILPGLELAADAARIAAETAQAACLEARRALAACEEEAQRRVAAGGMPMAAASPSATPAATTTPSGGWVSSSAPAPESTRAAGASRAGLSASPPAAPAPSAAAATQTDVAGTAAAAHALVRADRQALLGVALRLSEETGFEAGRLQLLLLELREQINARALDDFCFAHPAGHPFWSQFPADTARNVAVSLASMGYRFDGQDGWLDGRAPQLRDLALALSYAGLDPRSLRRPAGQPAIDALWQGTIVRSEDYLLARAPDLELPQIIALLGPGAAQLSELWDIWGRLRPLLMRRG